MLAHARRLASHISGRIRKKGGRSHTANRSFGWMLDNLKTLRGKNLACWCKPGTACHADVLLRLANEKLSD